MNLFKVFSPLQQFARSSLWPDDINFRLTAYIYPAYILLLLLGPQERSTNFGLNLFWCYWWPLSFIVYPFLGRIWCSGKQPSLCGTWPSGKGQGKVHQPIPLAGL